MTRIGNKQEKVAISGASGLVGRALSKVLARRGVEVVPMVRSRSRGIPWDPASGQLEADAFEGFSGIVHLAGENVAGRWTAAKKQRIESSRVLGTRLIAEKMAALKEPPKVLVCASAIGFYGDRGDEILTEESTRGEGFLADVCWRWEAAAAAARDAGIRVVHVRIGIVLSRGGGALEQMLTPFKLGVGGRLGDGRQWFSWIHLDDVVSILELALKNPEIAGPLNAVAPAPVRNQELTRSLGRVLGRPTILPAPAFVLKAAFGEMAEGALLASTRVSPRSLLDAGFEFRWPNLEPALHHELDSTD